MNASAKSSVDEIRARFDADVPRFSNLETGQSATMDSPLCLDLVARAAVATSGPVQQVLDVGCGAGNFSLKLREYAPAARFTLVDLSAPMLAKARERLDGAVDGAHQSDIRDLALPASSFDVIVAAAVLHHLRTPDEWQSVFRQFFAWLRPGGSLWVFDLVIHENPGVQRLLWENYRVYLEGLGGAAYAEKVFAYIEREDTPTTLAFQWSVAQAQGFTRLDLLHKNGPFAAYGVVKEGPTVAG